MERCQRALLTCGPLRWPAPMACRAARPPRLCQQLQQSEKKPNIKKQLSHTNPTAYAANSTLETSSCSIMAVRFVTLPRCINWQGFAAPNAVHVPDKLGRTQEEVAACTMRPVTSVCKTMPELLKHSHYTCTSSNFGWVTKFSDPPLFFRTAQYIPVLCTLYGIRVQ